MSMSPAAHAREEGQIFENFIAGEWRSSESGETFSSTNPANTQEIVGHFQTSTLADLNAAVAAAKKAQPAWAALPAPGQWGKHPPDRSWPRSARARRPRRGA